MGQPKAWGPNCGVSLVQAVVIPDIVVGSSKVGLDGFELRLLVSDCKPSLFACSTHLEALGRTTIFFDTLEHTTIH